MTDLRKEYLSYMKYRNYSAHTINHYCNSLINLSKHFNLSPDKLTREQLMEYLYYMVETKKVSTASLNQLISAYKILTVDILKREWVLIIFSLFF